MTEIMEALYAFWSQFGIPAYMDDQVPDDAVLPYITYQVAKGEFNSSTVLTAFNWHRRQLGGNADRADMMEMIAKAIPNEGVLLPIGREYLELRRNTAGFQTPWQDPEDANVIGGRTSYEVYFYVR